MSSILSTEEEYAAQVMARVDLYFFARYMFLKRRGQKWMRGAHHKDICDALMRVFKGECTRLIINIPPRYSKTELAVINFMAWALGLVPDAEFIHASYGGKLATHNASQCRDLVTHEAYQGIFPELEISRDSAAKNDWRTTKGGCVYAVGREGSTTGYGAGKAHEGFGGAIIIDDPHKADEARSDVMRQNVIDWFVQTLESRKNNPKSTPIIVIMQRLHQNDLTGWLLSGGNGEKWEHVNLPAIDQQGEALWPEKHSIQMLRQMQQAAPYMFAGQYMQSPTVAAGNIFKPDMIEIIPALPAGRIRWVRGWDLAASLPKPGSDPDYTAGMKLGRTSDDTFIIAHQLRDRGGPEASEAMVMNTAKSDGPRVYIDLPQDPGQAGKSQVLNYTKKLKGYKVSSSPESGDKVTRAESFAAQVNVGNVKMVQGEWNQPLKDEMRIFPSGNHDDQVDSGSRAFNKLLTLRNGFNISDDLLEKI